MTLAELRAAITATGQAWMEILAGNPGGETDNVEHGDGWDFHAAAGSASPRSSITAPTIEARSAPR